MRGPRSILAKLTVLAATLSWAPQVRAIPSYYSSGVGGTTACTACHTAAVAPLPTCNGCHAHGTHAGSAKSSINLVASTDKATYAPGEAVTVTVTGGYQSGWVRVNLYDESMTQLARSSCTPGGVGGCSTSVLPATLTTTAPATPGTYTWRAAWYGNVHEAAAGFTSPACGATVTPPCFRVDPGNATTGAVHGEEIVAVSQFTVAAASTPAIALAPTALSFGDVTVGASGTQTFTVSNTGGATLTGTVAVASGTSGEFAASPATFSIAAGGQPVTVTVTYTPNAVGADAGAVTVASNAPAAPTIDLPVSGAGVAQSAKKDDDGGCSGSGGSAGWLAVVTATLFAAGRLGRRRRPASQAGA